MPTSASARCQACGRDGARDGARDGHGMAITLCVAYEQLAKKRPRRGISHDFAEDSSEKRYRDGRIEVDVQECGLNLRPQASQQTPHKRWRPCRLRLTLQSYHNLTSPSYHLHSPHLINVSFIILSSLACLCYRGLPSSIVRLARMLAAGVALHLGILLFTPMLIRHHMDDPSINCGHLTTKDVSAASIAQKIQARAQTLCFPLTMLPQCRNHDVRLAPTDVTLSVGELVSLPVILL